MASLDPDNVRRIFVRAPNWVGDLVMATAGFARLRAGFPDARITGAMRPFLRPLLTGCSTGCLRESGGDGRPCRLFPGGTCRDEP